MWCTSILWICGSKRRGSTRMRSSLGPQILSLSTPRYIARFFQDCSRIYPSPHASASPHSAHITQIRSTLVVSRSHSFEYLSAISLSHIMDSRMSQNLSWPSYTISNQHVSSLGPAFALGRYTQVAPPKENSIVHDCYGEVDFQATLYVLTRRYYAPN
jgi:hypothetical protein